MFEIWCRACRTRNTTKQYNDAVLLLLHHHIEEPTHIAELKWIE